MASDEGSEKFKLAYDLAAHTDQFEGDMLAALQMLHAAEGWRGAKLPPQCEQRPADPEAG